MKRCELSVEDLLQINEYCDLFEKALRKNSTTSIGPFLNRVSPPLKKFALRELLLTEASVRTELDMTLLTLETYLDEFPEHEATLTKFFCG